MPLHKIPQSELLTKIIQFIGIKCKVKHLNDRELNVILDCVNKIVDELAKPPLPVSENMGLKEWLLCDQTGLSSLYMASILSGQFVKEIAHPYDACDFGRCLGLLDACPEFRAKLDLMSDCSKEWEALVAYWDELEKLFHEEIQTGSTPKLNEKLAELLKFL